MAKPAAARANDYNAKIIEEFRANEGRVGWPWVGTTLILVHHLGARSGAEAPQLVEYQARITRRIPVFMLTRQD